MQSVLFELLVPETSISSEIQEYQASLKHATSAVFVSHALLGKVRAKVVNSLSHGQKTVLHDASQLGTEESSMTEDRFDVVDKNRVQVKNRYGFHVGKLGGLPVFQTKTLSLSKVLKDKADLPNYDALVRYCENLSIPLLPITLSTKASKST